MDILSPVLIAGLLAAAVRQACPLLLAASGEIWSERAGVLNVGLEGAMLMGALAGFLGAYYGGDRAWLGMGAALLTGAAAGALLSILTVYVGIDQVVTGISFNLAALGFTSFAYQKLLRDSMVPPSITGFRGPSLGGAWGAAGTFLEGMDILIPLTFLLIPLSWWFLSRSAIGLTVKAVGEHPQAAESAGISIRRVRFICSTLSITGAALGGACLTLAHVKLFTENMTAGRGFIALAVVVFSGWRPWRALAACLLFGLAEGLQLRLQGLGVNVPKELLMILPYVLCIAVLALNSKQTKPPKSLGVAAQTQS